ncbi:hypothetical protein HRR83_003542 [Exophiala dermatitidis]|uniref:Beta-fructofuranosidase n=2 Tax=Exophiala dermatitidis TaxID=5970 RepID=H6BSC7_EXODN|nr:beta-fructofuranosidase [Exophiala dermatitidis NIH/UT8656]KAJ4519148.1 hypothetical protein HRR75_002826 [Exophiala dermatitidis]EHY53333.1 beta-fructofuranosidase [Exophiala dermatitidis NIH/UT8656]KAJ4522496.1 hypothetical protein HRR74_003081 [Exophiala dermatitidis]KAJ4543012.1 hypothetical protein HRR77_005274 [Exophiala dermatitidis]KAJ4543513.1 hypothetical protein HRR76_001582 [Exophiala dermatitidis]
MMFALLLLALTGSSSQMLTSDTIQSMANNSLFERWRPYSHFSAPAGWMNDPCGPLYDPVGNLYHMHYQWHPNHVQWGNISWGHATSEDMITWTDVAHSGPGRTLAWLESQAQSIGTSNLTSTKHDPHMYNFLGIFSGTAQPVNFSGEVDGTLLAFYTSVSRGPLSWDQPYPEGAESQSLAYSTDGGMTWAEYAGNPVINGPPAGWNITGFRDPFFHASPELDSLLDHSEPHYYVVFGSGIGDVGPRIPLYSAPASNLTIWTYLGALWEPRGNTSLGSTYETGTWAWNFEVPNFFQLDGYWFFSSAAQGGSTSYHPQNWVVWNEGNVSARDNGSVAFEPISMGVVDWGLLYAITSFNDTKNNRRIQIGWAQEDMNNFGIVQQGYQGALSIPRELFVLQTSDVTPVKRNSSSVYTRQANGTYNARTLGARPAPDVIRGLRNGSHAVNFSVDGLEGKGGGSGSNILVKAMSRAYEVSVTIASTTGRTGLIIGVSPDFEEFTSIYYDPATSTIACNRTYSSTIKEFANTTHLGFFEPYNVSGRLESVRFNVFVDGSLVEIFVNDRFALTSRIYPSRLDSSGFGLYAETGVNVTYSGPVEVWSGLRNVWPDRPSNSSSLLVYDTDAETNNRTWWTGL